MIKTVTTTLYLFPSSVHQMAQIVLTENTSGEDVTSTSFCFANRSACLDFIKSSLSIKASLALHENSTLKNNTVNTEIKSQPNVLDKFLKDDSTA